MESQEGVGCLAREASGKWLSPPEKGLISASLKLGKEMRIFTYREIPYKKA